MDLTLKSEKTTEKFDDSDISRDTDFITNDSAISVYLKEISKFPILTPEEEQDLARKIANKDKIAKEKFINSNLRLVVSIAKRYRNEQIDIMDLIQEGNIGLIKAVEMFDYTKGFKFSTYATWWIKRYIMRALDNKAELIRIPIHIKELIYRYQMIQNSYYKNYGRNATDLEVSKEMNINIDNVKEIKYHIYNVISLNSKISIEGETELEDVIEDDKETLEDDFIKKSTGELLEILIANSNLNEIEKTIIRLRYDFEKHETNTLDFVAKKIGKSKDRIRIIERKSINKLRINAVRKFGRKFFL